MTECVDWPMGKDKIRYVAYSYGRWRWRPTKAMRASGFEDIVLGPGTIVHGKPALTTEESAKALRLNASWDRVRRGLPEAAVAERAFPPGSIGAAYKRAMALRETERQQRGIFWTKEQHSRDDWPRAWKWIEPLFADCDPTTVTPEQIIGDPNGPNTTGLRPLVAAMVSESEAHRVIKVWRALWKKMAVFGYCEADRDPSLLFVNSAPKPRDQSWTEGEAVRLVKAAWRSGYCGLAALLAVAWDSQLSPVDTRGLRARDLGSDPVGLYFSVDRAKTGRSALATLSKRTVRLLAAYVDGLGVDLVGPAHIFRNRSKRPYSKDTLGDDFREIRLSVFGPDETRWLADFRRSGSVEAVVGGVVPMHLSAKMANSISTSNRLHMTYSPVQLAAVRGADEARRRGRAKMRSEEPKPDDSCRRPAEKLQNARQLIAKSLK